MSPTIKLNEITREKKWTLLTFEFLNCKEKVKQREQQIKWKETSLSAIR